MLKKVASKPSGRPKSKRMKILENKLNRLTRQLEEFQAKGIAELDESILGQRAFTVTKEKDRYFLSIFKVSTVLGVGKLEKKIDVGDAEHRAMFELNKYLAHNFKIQTGG